MVWQKHFKPPDDTFFIEGTRGPGYRTELDEYLKSIGVTELIVCVDTTVRAAMDYGYSVKVVADACATMDLTINGKTVPADMVRKAFIAALAGVFATIV